MSKDLSDKAIDIKGKKYALVKDRILWLDSDENKEAYSIETNYDFFPEQRTWVVKATLKLGDRSYTGLAQEVESDDYKTVNATSALENCETSAVGRACAMAGIGVLESIASVDEINKSSNRSRGMSDKQKEWLRSEARKASGYEHNDDVDKWISETLGESIDELAGYATKSNVDKIRAIAKLEDETANQLREDIPF